MISLSSLNKSLLAVAIASSFLAGCNDDLATNNTQTPDTGKPPTETIPPTDIVPPTETIPPTDIIPPTTYTASLFASGKVITGDVDCNGTSLTKGTFDVSQGTSFTCSLGSVTLGDFTAPFPQESQSKALTASANPPANDDNKTLSFELTKDGNQNAAKILQSINSCESDDKICLQEIDSYDIEDVYQHLDDNDAVDAYFAAKEEKATDEVGKAPSSHVDNTVVPAVDPAANNDLNSNFVSANAEASHAYKPSTEAQVLTRSKLTDSKGTPIAGMSFFSAHSSGMTDENGEFEYKWGDTISFGIDTFEFGKVTGNQVDYKLTDVTDNPVTKENIQALVERYATNQGSSYQITDNIHQTFAKYPNVINELINLALPNGERLEGSPFSLPNEFEAQFSNGLTADIDSELRVAGTVAPIMYRAYSAPVPEALSIDSSGKYVTNTLHKLFANVSSFHVFNDNGSFYSSTGYTRGMRALNISNEAFPIMMPRTDINHTIPFGLQQAWTREGKPYIAEYNDIPMPKIPLVSKDNATYGFPFVTAGSIGKGKVVFMGNAMYPSILSCPDNYWANSKLQIDSAAKTCTATAVENQKHNDNGDMKRFFANLFEWFNNGESTAGINVATNIGTAYAAYHNGGYNGIHLGREYSFFISSEYGLGSVTPLTTGGFTGLSAENTPILILQAYPPKSLPDGQSNRLLADLDNPNLSQDDITALIKYINDGGNVLFMDAIQTTNPEPIGRLADAAGVMLGGQNVTPTNQTFCGSSYYCQSPYPNPHVKGQKDMVVLERFPDKDGKQPFVVQQDGSVEWTDEKAKLEIPTYQAPKLDSQGNPELDSNGQPVMVEKQARIFVETPQERDAAIAELQHAFEGTPVCSNAYEYEFNCIETRSGDGMTDRGSYGRSDFDRYPVSKDVIESMVKAANLGSNFTALYNHEIYYRTQGKQGQRLSTAALNQAYDNLAVWMWNDNPYRYETNVQDELGFKQAVQFLNCYTDGQHQVNAGEANCPVDLKASLVANKMIHGSGELSDQLNPSYPLNYMEKPLTRIMLGRSYWDHQIVVDTTQYPGRTTGVGSSATATIETGGNAVTYSAGNNQSTGLWAPQLQQVTVSGGVEATITVMMADDLTGKPKHEVSLKRPPRMQTSYHYDGSSLNFTAPYGGLIYIKPKVKGSGEQTFNFNGVEQAAWWKDGHWVNTPSSAQAPIAEVDTGSFIYTTAVHNLSDTDLDQFAKDMNRFADAASDFYGRDEVVEGGKHRRFTYSGLKGFRHRFVNDVQISIGAAHSGYPVMNTGFNASRNTVPTNAVDDWLIWHEVGHNLASAPFVAEGSTEVTNNLLALYMQELEGRNANPQMDRISADIRKAPMWLGSNRGHAWANGDAGMRLVMFGQLKIWAKNHFSLDNWYASSDEKPAIYGKDAGWNMIKLMHRKARGDVQGDTLQGRNGINYCSPKDTRLSGGNLMMVCSSYVSGYDLSDFFQQWNVGETSMTNPDGSKVYGGGIDAKGLEKLAELNLKKPSSNPLNVNSLSYSN